MKRALADYTEAGGRGDAAVDQEEAAAVMRLEYEVGFFQEVRAGLAKAAVEGEGKRPEEMDAAIRQLVSRAAAGKLIGRQFSI